jgi:hypothetical protein
VWSGKTDWSPFVPRVKELRTKQQGAI